MPETSITLRSQPIDFLDFSPRWIRTNIYRLGEGISFDCPHCRKIRIVIWFSNPVDDREPFDEARSYWERKGNSFETLSLDKLVISPDHWMGEIKEGKLFTR